MRKSDTYSVTGGVDGGYVLKGYRLPWISHLFPLVFCVGLLGVTHAQNPRSPLANYEGQFQTEKLSRNGFDLYYRSLGTGEPVLILSGGPGDDCDYMLPVAAEIAKNAHAILLEQRGTGRSIPPRVDKSTISLALYLQDFEALRVHLQAQRWTVVGHSAGGILAMDYAAAYPERVSKLILLDTAPVAFQHLIAFQDNILDRLSLEDRDRLATLEKANSPQARAAIAELQAKGLFFDRAIGEQLADELSNAWHADVGHLLGEEITAPGYDLRPHLKNFDNPVLVLNGRQDPMDPLMAYETAAAFKHSTLKFIDRAGHFPWFDQPKDFDAAIEDFLVSR
jgi:proline iminopeptidase